MSHYFFFKIQGTIINLGNKSTVFQIIVCETVATKRRINFLFEFFDNARGWYILHKS